MDESRRLTDHQVLKGLAHPLRQRPYRLLAQGGPSTVTVLANVFPFFHAFPEKP